MLYFGLSSFNIFGWELKSGSDKMRRGEEELELKFLSLETNLALFQTGPKIVKLQAMPGSQYTTNSLRLLKCTSYRLYQASDTLPYCYFACYAMPVYYY